MATKKQVQERTNKLQELGLTLDSENNYSTGSISVTESDIRKLKDTEWEKLISDMVVAINAALPFTPAEDVPHGQSVGVVIPLTFEQEVEQEVGKSIVKLDVNKEKAAKFKEDYSGLSIASFEDKKGFEAVEAAKKIVRKARTTLEAKRKEVKKYFVEVGRGIDAYASDVNKPIEEVESHLDAELAKYKEWQEADDKRKEEESSRKKNERVAALTGAGMVFTGVWYAIGENITMDIVSIEGMSDTDFDFLLEKVKAEKIRLDKEAEIARNKERIDKLTFIGMVSDTVEGVFRFVNEFATVVLPYHDLQSLTDEAFNRAFGNMKTMIESAKQRILDKAEDDRKKFEQEKEDLRREKIAMRQGKAENIGLVFNPTTLSYFFKNKYTEVSIAGQFIETSDNDSFNAKIVEIYSIISIAKNNEAVAAKKELETKQMVEDRVAQLTGIGFINLGNCYAYPESQLSATIADIESTPNQVWYKVFAYLVEGKAVFLKAKDDEIIEEQRIEKLWMSRLAEFQNVALDEDLVYAKYDFEAIVISLSDLKTLSDADFNTLRDAHNEIERMRLQKIEDDKAQAEKVQTELEERFKARKNELSAMGVLLIDNNFCFSVEKQWRQILTPKEAFDTTAENWPVVVASMVDNIEHAQTEERESIEAIEAEKQRLTPEIDKVIAFVNAMSAVKVPEIKDQKLIGILGVFAVDFSNASQKLRAVISNLI